MTKEELAATRTRIEDGLERAWYVIEEYRKLLRRLEELESCAPAEAVV